MLYWAALRLCLPCISWYKPLYRSFWSNSTMILREDSQWQQHDDEWRNQQGSFFFYFRHPTSNKIHGEDSDWNKSTTSEDHRKHIPRGSGHGWKEHTTEGGQNPDEHIDLAIIINNNQKYINSIANTTHWFIQPAFRIWSGYRTNYVFREEALNICK